jgi:acyl-lipid omega-6 desaturase (Delta-12 desaturase)
LALSKGSVGGNERSELTMPAVSPFHDQRDPEYFVGSADGARIATTPIIARRELIRRLNRYATRSTGAAILYFITDFAIYAIALSGVLFLSPLALKLCCSVITGLALGRLFSFAHNAAHENLAKGRTLNRVLAFFAFTPFFYNYQLWAFEHHQWHHPALNDAKPDAYKPFSKVDFDNLPWWRRALERFYRAPNVFGWGAYYLIERHITTKLYPPKYIPSTFRWRAWLNAAWLLLYLCTFSIFLLDAASYATNLTGLSAILLGLVIPFLVFEIADGFTLYAQHTDPMIPWFKDAAVDRNGVGRGEMLTVHLKVPLIYRWWSHDTHAHPVHHLLPGIPFYHAYEAQLELDQLLGSAAIVRTLGLRWWLDTMRRCKLYDWDKQQWLDFSGNPTAPSLANRQRAQVTLSNCSSL